jgi:hypothetical protein
MRARPEHLEGNMKLQKRIISMIAAGLLVFGAAACNGDTTDTTVDDGVGTTTDDGLGDDGLGDDGFEDDGLGDDDELDS